MFACTCDFLNFLNHSLNYHIELFDKIIQYDKFEIKFHNIISGTYYSLKI